MIEIDVEEFAAQLKAGQALAVKMVPFSAIKLRI